MDNNRVELHANILFDVACSFNEAANRCNGSNRPPQWWTAKELIPEIVNRAFACEVYLKALLCHKKITFDRIHKLEELWSKVPLAEQEEVKTETQKLMGFDETMTWDDALSNISNAFVDWRYSYEHDTKSIYIGFLHAFCDALREICCQKIEHCTWRVHEGWHDGEI